MEVPRHWRLKSQRYRLQGTACPTCGQPSFPPRPVCPYCGANREQSTAYTLLILPESERTLDAIPAKGE